MLSLHFSLEIFIQFWLGNTKVWSFFNVNKSDIELRFTNNSVTSLSFSDGGGGGGGGGGKKEKYKET